MLLSFVYHQVYILSSAAIFVDVVAVVSCRISVSSLLLFVAISVLFFFSLGWQQRSFLSYGNHFTRANLWGVEGTEGGQPFGSDVYTATGICRATHVHASLIQRLFIVGTWDSRTPVSATRRECWVSPALASSILNRLQPSQNTPGLICVPENTASRSVFRPSYGFKLTLG